MRYTSAKGFRNGMQQRQHLLREIAGFIHTFGRPLDTGGHSFEGMDFGGRESSYRFMSTTVATFSILQERGVFGRGEKDCHCSYLSVDELTVLSDSFRIFAGYLAVRKMPNAMAEAIVDLMKGFRADISEVDLSLPSGLQVSSIMRDGYVMVGKHESVPDSRLGLMRPKYLSGIVHVNSLQLTDLVVLSCYLAGKGDPAVIREMKKRLKSAGALPDEWEVEDVVCPGETLEVGVASTEGKGVMVYSFWGSFLESRGNTPVRDKASACAIF